MIFTAAWLLHRRSRGRIDVVHGCNPPDLFWLFGRIARGEGGAYVFDQHDVGPELATTKWGARGLRARALASITRGLERRSYETADLVLAPNDSYREIALSRGGVAADDILMIRNAPDVTRYRELAANAVVDPHRVGYVGVMGSQDGLDLLLDAWAIVTREPDLADAVLELVGDGEARGALERQARQLGLGDHVRFHGYRRAADFVPVLASCAVGISPDPPTPFNDVSTMVKVVDYLAMGRGVVAFDLRETRSVAGDAAVIASPATAEGLAQTLVGVMRDPELARRLGEAGAARVAAIGLDWSRSASALAGGYARLLDRERARRADSGVGPGARVLGEEAGLRIAFIGIRGVPANYGGFETFVEELGGRLVEAGHEVTVFGRDRWVPAAIREHRGMRIVRLPAPRSKYFETVIHTLFAAFALLLGRYDVVYVCNSANVPAVVVLLAARRRVVLNVDGLEWRRAKWNRIGRLYYRACAWIAARLPAEIVTDALVIQEHYREAYGRETTYFPYGTEIGSVAEDGLLASLGLETDRYILYVSRLEPENNAHVVIQAYAGVDTDLPLAVVGDAPYASDYIASPARHGRSTRPVPRRDLRPWLPRPPVQCDRLRPGD